MESSAVGTELSMMLSQLFDGAEIRGVHRLSGGASRETWRFEADGRPLILQRQRAGDERASDRHRGACGETDDCAPRAWAQARPVRFNSRHQRPGARAIKVTEARTAPLEHIRV